MQKSSIEKEIEEYCKLNQIKNIKKFKDDLLQKAFYILIYGEKPNVLQDKKNQDKNVDNEIKCDTEIKNVKRIKIVKQ